LVALRRSRLRVVALPALVILLAGCGTNDRVKDPRREDAVKRCLEQAKKIEDGSSRRTAEESCRAAGSGDQSRAREAARQQCLDQARRFPDANARRQAEQACRRIG
jgi:hypothetical protein